MSCQTVLYSVENKIATLSINRPEALNAFANETFPEMRAALEEAGRDPAVGAVVLTGTGKNFSAGGDLKVFREMVDRKVYLEPQVIEAAGQMGIAARRCPKPVLAMVNGVAAGAGCGLALACDFRIMTPKSRLVTAFIKLGLSGDSSVFYFLSRLAGLGRATEWMMLGEPIDGVRALECGLATRLAEEGQLAELTYALAARLAAGPLAAYRKQKALFNEFLYPDLERIVSREAEYMDHCSRTEDFDQALNAFLARREPVFTGR